MLKILKHKKTIWIFLAIITSLFGLIGFSTLDEKLSLLEIINYTLGVFVFEWTGHHNTLIDIATMLGIFTTSFGIVIVVFSKFLNKRYVKSIQKREHDLVIGLSEQNRNLLENFDTNTPVIIIEQDRENRYLKEYKERGFGIKEAEAEDAIKKLDFTNMKRCIISTGNDRKNIALGKEILSRLETKKRQTIYICISNRDLSVLFKQAVIASDQSKNVDVITYSLYENMTKKLFLEHNILGEQSRIIHTQEDYNISGVAT